MESCPRQAVLPWVGLAAKKVIRDRYKLPAATHAKVTAFNGIWLPLPYLLGWRET
ncbi:MAG: hypothetical protein ACQESR_21080 [Planctomycetota bacterium]